MLKFYFIIAVIVDSGVRYDEMSFSGSNVYVTGIAKILGTRFKYTAVQ